MDFKIGIFRTSNFDNHVTSYSITSVITCSLFLCYCTGLIQISFLPNIFTKSQLPYPSKTLSHRLCEGFKFNIFYNKCPKSILAPESGPSKGVPPPKNHEETTS